RAIAIAERDAHSRWNGCRCGEYGGAGGRRTIGGQASFISTRRIEGLIAVHDEGEIEFAIAVEIAGDDAPRGGGRDTSAPNRRAERAIAVAGEQADLGVGVEDILRLGDGDIGEAIAVEITDRELASVGSDVGGDRRGEHAAAKIEEHEGG